MKLIKKSICITVLVVTLLLFTGCTAVIRPTISQSEFISNTTKIPATVELYITKEFKECNYEHFDWWCDATNYSMQLGPLASDWFRYAFESNFETVMTKSGQPKLPLTNSNTDLVITPEFTSFKAGGPVVVKLEAYWVEIGMNVKIQDAQGQVLDTLELKEKGSKGGTIGINPGTHVYPEVCRMAIKSIVEKTLDRAIELSKK